MSAGSCRSHRRHIWGGRNAHLDLRTQGRHSCQPCHIRCRVHRFRQSNRHLPNKEGVGSGCSLDSRQGRRRRPAVVRGLAMHGGGLGGLGECLVGGTPVDAHYDGRLTSIYFIGGAISFLLCLLALLVGMRAISRFPACMLGWRLACDALLSLQACSSPIFILPKKCAPGCVPATFALSAHALCS